MWLVCLQEKSAISMPWVCESLGSSSRVSSETSATETPPDIPCALSMLTNNHVFFTNTTWNRVRMVYNRAGKYAERVGFPRDGR